MENRAREVKLQVLDFYVCGDILTSILNLPDPVAITDPVLVPKKTGQHVCYHSLSVHLPHKFLNSFTVSSLKYLVKTHKCTESHRNLNGSFKQCSTEKNMYDNYSLRSALCFLGWLGLSTQRRNSNYIRQNVLHKYTSMVKLIT